MSDTYIDIPLGGIALGDIDRLTSQVGANSTLILTDDSTDQTLTGNLGDLILDPTTNLVLASGKKFRATAAGSPSAPEYSFTTSVATGMYLPQVNVLGFATAAALRFSIANTYTQSENPMRVAGGTVGLPDFTWRDDINSGIYRIGSDNIGISCGNQKILDISKTLLETTVPLILPTGALATTPTMYWSGDTNTGFGHTSVSPDRINVICGGVNTVAFFSTNTTGTVPFLGPSGSAAAPGLGFWTDTDSGWFRKASDSVALSLGGAEKWQWESSGHFIPNGSALNIGDTSNLVAVLYGIEQNAQANTMRHYTSLADGGVASNPYQFLWDVDTVPGSITEGLFMWKLSMTVGSGVERDMMMFLPDYNAGGGSGNPALLIRRTPSAESGGTPGRLGFITDADLNNFSGIYVNGSSMWFYNQSALAFYTQTAGGGGLSFNYSMFTANGNWMRIGAGINSFAPNQTFIYVKHRFTGTTVAGQKGMEWYDAGNSTVLGSQWFAPDLGGFGVPADCIGMSFDDSGYTRGDTYFLYDSGGSTLDCFVDGAEIWNASSTALQHVATNLGFFSTAPTTQPTALTGSLTGVTHTGPTTPDYAIATPVDSSAGAAWGFSTQDEFETIMSVIANLQTRQDELESKLQALGLLA